MALTKKNPLDIYAGTDGEIPAALTKKNPLDIYAGTDGEIPAVDGTPMALTKKNPLDIYAGTDGEIPAVDGTPTLKPPMPAATLGGTRGGGAAAESKPGAFARGAFDAAAIANDAMGAPMTGLLDYTNRALVMARNFGRQGLGKQPVQPIDFNYSPTQDALVAAREQNTTPVAAVPRLQAPATAAPAAVVAQPAAAPAAVVAQPTALAGPSPENYDATKDTNPAPNTFMGRPINLPAATAQAAPTANNGLAVQPGAITPNLAPPPNYTAPQVNLGGDRYGAEQERQKQLESIKNSIYQLGTLNSRGKREIYRQLLAQQQELVGKRYDLAGRLDETGAQLANQGAIAAQGENAQAAEGAAGRAAIANEATLRRNFDYEQSGTPATDTNGNAFRLRGTDATPINVPDGKQFRPALTRDQTAADPRIELISKQRELAVKNALSPEEQATALAAFDATPAGQELQAYIQGSSRQPDQQGGAPPGMVFIGTKNGKRAYRDSSGQTQLEQ
jgi:hypothetical protein